MRQRGIWYEVEQVEHCWIELADGTRLSARLWLPKMPGEQPTPAILEYNPYRKRDMSRVRDERNHLFFARHGYACARVDIRGSGDSEGSITDMYSLEELDDAVEVIEWIAGQSWCDGSVGMMGTSWGGTASLQAAARQPAALKAIIAVCATNNRFDDDIHHMGGCLLTDTVEWGATLPAILASPPDPETVGPHWHTMWMQRLEGIGFPLQNWMEHETRDSYWRWGAVDETPDDVVCPVLAIGGWADRYSNTVMNLLARSQGRCWGIIGPWGHHYPDLGRPGPAMGFQQEALRWWDYWLKGWDTGVDCEPALRVWMQQYDSPADRIDTRSGSWVSEPEWPSANIVSKDLWLYSSLLQPGRPEHQETAVVPVALQVGAGAGDTGYFGRSGGLALDQQTDDEHSLTFETQPLEQYMQILGAVRLQVTLHTDQSVATLVARLSDVEPGGEAARVSYAVKNLALNDDGTAANRLRASEPETFTIDFPNVAYSFAPGHRIRLALSSSYWPIIWLPPRPATLQLHLAHSRLTLPVRDKRACNRPVSFAGPMEAEGPAIRIISSPSLERRVDIDPDSGRRAIRWHQPFKCVVFTDIDLEFGFETRADHSIVGEDPNSAVSRFEHWLHFRRGQWVIDVTGTAELTATETTYNLVGSIEARENDEIVFERRWAPVIPRSCS